MKKFFVFLGIVFVLAACGSGSQNTNEDSDRNIEVVEASGERIALIIGNSDYSIGQLRNPVNDANLMKQVLEEQGFTVLKYTNATQNEMREAFGEFSERLSDGCVGLFYYAGHGVQLDGVNYLVPTDANLDNEGDVKIRCENVATILETMKDAKTALNILILDACRDNPFARSWSRSLTRGLAQMSAEGSLIMYATGDGKTADDGQGSNGLFTQNLAQQIRNGKDLPVTQIFKRVQQGVAEESNRQQVPALYDNSINDFFFSGSGNDNPNPPQPEPNEIPDNFVLIEGGVFLMGSNNGENNEKPVHIVTVSTFYMSKYEVTVAEFKEFIDATGHQTDADKRTSGYGSYIYDGSNWVKKDGVNWMCDAEGNIRSTSDYNHPVIHVSWNDAVAYCQWLSQKNGKTYSLPTEAEWEYAAGNGSRHTMYSWGDGNPSGRNGGNVADMTAKRKFSGWTIFEGYDDGYVYTAPVGSFNPNSLGLCDMTGNVWEWCSDWYGDYPSDSQTNPTGAATGSSRVNRGGSWSNYARHCRSAYRYDDTPGNRYYHLGFRLVLAP